MTDQGFTKVSQRHIFHDDYLGLREDVIRGPSGQLHRRKVVEYRRASVILPVDEHDRILLVRHYRHPIQRCLWEAPGGMVSDGEAPETAAVRELREETGYDARQVDHLGTFHPEPAFTNHQIDVFLGRQIQRYPATLRAEDEISRVRTFSIVDVNNLMARGEIASSWTVIAILMSLRTRFGGPGFGMHSSA